MAVRNGVSVSSIPFEQRFQPPDPRRRKRERLTVSDRLVCALCGAFLGFVLWTAGYVTLICFTMKVAARQLPAANRPVDPFEWLPPFWWGCSIAVGFSLFGAVVGAERMMDGFTNVLALEGKIADAMNRY